MKEEKIQTLHPKGKQGVNISKDKYDTTTVKLDVEARNLIVCDRNSSPQMIRLAKAE